jgi:hypothetical protein
MAELQTSYTDTVPAAYPGMVANGETSNRITRTNEDATGIPFGKAVFRGSGDHGCTATVGASSATFLGVAIAHAGQALVAGQDADEYQQYDNVAIMTAGAIWVTAGEAVTDGAQVYAEAVTGDFVDTSTSNVLLTGWFFDTTGADASLVRIVKR